MNNKKPLWWWVVGVVLVMMFIRSSYSMISRTALEFQMFEFYNLRWFGTLLFSIAILVNAISIYSLIKRNRSGYKWISAFFFLSAALVLCVMFLKAPVDTQTLVDLMRISRDARGLTSVGPDYLVNPLFMWTVTLIYSLIYLSLAYLVIKKRGYFGKNEA